MSERTFDIALYEDESGMWVAECMDVPGCVSQGSTEAEAIENIREALAGCLEARRDNGMPETVVRRHIRISA
ncbi:MAG: type II toxin-antitoxin system HicB family antitoxin [Fimbriimonadales bacterium]